MKAFWALFAWACLSAAAHAEEILGAWFLEPTTRYGHAVLGDNIEYGALEIELAGGETLQIRLPKDHVFEDLTPRLWDVTGDGLPEIVVVETDMARGGALAIYGVNGKIAETPHIGQRNRWLAPIGAADFDGDGTIEVAFVDRPHLAKRVRLWRLEGGKMREVGQIAGFSNHRIGEDFISGGVRACGQAPEMVLATAAWDGLVGLSFDGSTFAIREIGPFRGPQSFAEALAC